MKKIGLLILALTLSQVTFAEIWKDYKPGDDVLNVTHVKVKTNSMDDYLMGLKKTWVPFANFQKEQGYMKDWSIYTSSTPSGGDYNLTIVTVFDNASDMAPNAERYKAINDYMTKMTEESEQETIVEGYEQMREFVGEYNIREVIFE